MNYDYYKNIVQYIYNFSEYMSTHIYETKPSKYVYAIRHQI